MINGNIKDTADVLHSRIYFDQGGTLIQKFGIRQVPAIVEQARVNSYCVSLKWD
ncbi:TraW [Klebsiella pneumoniae]|nr:TraW [Klebsiella pneumoniae]